MPDFYSMIAVALAGLAIAVGVGVLGVVGLLAAAVAVFAASTLWGMAAGRRLAARTLSDPRFERTDEVFLDNRGGKVMRVYADPRTGERRYVKD